MAKMVVLIAHPSGEPSDSATESAKDFMDNVVASLSYFSSILKFGILRTSGTGWESPVPLLACFAKRRPS